MIKILEDLQKLNENEDKLEVTIQTGKNNRVDGKYYVNIFPKRNHPLANTLMTELKVTKDSAQHFENSTEAKNWLNDFKCRHNVELLIIEK